jgi:polyhydroxybutyrate depolymerase
MRVITLLLMALAATPAVALCQSRSTTVTVVVDGVPRRALVFTPTAGSDRAAPLLFAFHGAGDTASNFSQVGFHIAWPSATVVYMDGLGRGPGSGGVFQTTDTGANNRDLKFFDAMLAELRSTRPVDANSIYATGFSNGAKFVYLLWATRPSVIAGLAPVAGMLTANTTFQHPKPLLHIGGRQDRQNEFQLQLASVEMGRRTNTVQGPGVSCGDSCLVYRDGEQPVMTILHDGGHVYPSDATARIVQFFRELRPPAPR